jgi:RHS repeat-associated protein
MAPSFTRLAEVVTYSDLEHVSIVDATTVGTGTDERAVTLINGLGENVARFERDGNKWVVSHWARADYSGRVIESMWPWSYAGDPVTTGSAADRFPVPLAEKWTAEYDVFGRLVATHDVPADGISLQTSRRDYHPLALETRDAEQLSAGGRHSGAFSRHVFDGHGRVVETLQHLATGDVLTKLDYDVNGNVTKIQRGSYVRTLRYDVFGRLKLNAEPNSGSNWRYEWDELGRLVGTSDARGCGVNFHYDGLGRIRGEDYSPCEASHEPYTTPDPVTGEGFEVLYSYDEYEPDQIESDGVFVDSSTLARGRLTAVRDRGSHTRFNYDSRGRVRRVSRRLAKPGAGTQVADRYDQYWFKSRSDYDLGDRLLVRSSGTDAPELLVNGKSEEKYIYDSRGALKTVGGSYGTFVHRIDYSVDGRVERANFGDGARTFATMTYDARRRLERLDILREAPMFWSSSAQGYPKPDASTTQTVLAMLKFTLDGVGNPKTIEDQTNFAQYREEAWPVRKREIEYDDMYRVSGVRYEYGGSSGAAMFRSPYSADLGDGSARAVPLQTQLPTRVASQSYEYNDIGNIVVSHDDLAATYDRSLGVSTHGTSTDGPNQFRSSDGVTASYDLAGNLRELKLSRNGECPSIGSSRCLQWFAYDWDEVGNLARARRWDFGSRLPILPDGTLPTDAPAWDLEYAYSRGGRVRKTAKEPSAPARHTLSVFDTLRLEDSAFDDAQGQYARTAKETRLYLGGMATVFYDVTGALPVAPSQQGNQVHAFLRMPDHLGSSMASIELASGELVERTSFQAYGATESDYRPERWQSYREPYKFTGKEEDIEVGLVYFGARYYHPHLGTWASPDPFAIHGLRGDLNPYAYVSGRVFRDTDPLGLESPPWGTQFVDHGQYWSYSVKGSDTHFEVGTWGGGGNGALSTALTKISGIDRAMQAGYQLAATKISLPMGKHMTYGNVQKAAANEVMQMATDTASMMPTVALANLIGKGIRKAAGVPEPPPLFTVQGDDGDISESVGTGLVVAASLAIGAESGAAGRAAEGAATIDTALVRFSQDSVKASFRNGTTLNDAAAALRAGGAEAASAYPPIRLFARNGALFTLDNRRLLVFSEAGLQVPFRMATEAEVAAEMTGPFSKFTTTASQGWGRFITVRGGQ